MSEPVPVVSVVDDDAAFLGAVARLLRASGYLVRTFPDAESFLAQPTDTPGCVIADLRMPGLSGIELQAALARAECAPPMIFLTGQGDIPSCAHAMRQGAEDFLTKTAPKEDLLRAVARALARDVHQRAEHLRRRAVQARFDALTPRERDVLRHLGSGALNKQIAAALNIGERMVKLHRSAITRKLQVRSVAEITRLVQEAGTFEEQPPTFPKGK